MERQRELVHNLLNAPIFNYLEQLNLDFQIQEPSTSIFNTTIGKWNNNGSLYMSKGVNLHLHLHLKSKGMATNMLKNKKKHTVNQLQLKSDQTLHQTISS